MSPKMDRRIWDLEHKDMFTDIAVQLRFIYILNNNFILYMSIIALVPAYNP